MLVIDNYREILHCLDIDSVVSYCLTCKNHYDSGFWLTKFNNLCLVDDTPNTLYDWIMVSKKVLYADTKTQHCMSFILPKITEQYNNYIYINFTFDSDVSKLFPDNFEHKSTMKELDHLDDIYTKKISIRLVPNLYLEYNVYIDKGRLSHTLYTTITLDILHTLIYRIYYKDPIYYIEVCYYNGHYYVGKYL